MFRLDYQYVWGILVAAVIQKFVDRMFDKLQQPLFELINPLLENSTFFTVIKLVCNILLLVIIAVPVGFLIQLFMNKKAQVLRNKKIKKYRLNSMGELAEAIKNLFSEEFILDLCKISGSEYIHENYQNKLKIAKSNAINSLTIDHPLTKLLIDLEKALIKMERIGKKDISSILELQKGFCSNNVLTRFLNSLGSEMPDI